MSLRFRCSCFVCLLFVTTSKGTFVNMPLEMFNMINGDLKGFLLYLLTFEV